MTTVKANAQPSNIGAHSALQLSDPAMTGANKSFQTNELANLPNRDYIT